MSASPAGRPGTTPNGAAVGTTPSNGAPAARPRPKPKANPLVQPRRPNRGAAKSGVPSQKSAAAQRTTPIPNGSQQSRQSSQINGDVQRLEPPPNAKVEIYPVTTTKRALLEGLRHHVMRFQSKAPIDPTDQSSFTRPIRLHRRDAGAGKSGAGADNGEEENDEDVQERARIEALKEERKRNRQEIQAQIAPKAKGKSGYTDNKKKIQQVYERNDTPEAVKASRLRYEETLPWHLEDFDNKNTWVGSYESALSDNHVMFFTEAWIDQNGQQRTKLRMVPVEKWYKFSAKDKGIVFSADLVEKHEKRKGGNLPRWIAKDEEKVEVKMPTWIKQKDEEDARKKQIQQLGKKGRIFARSGGRGDEEGPKIKIDDSDNYRPEVAADADDIDWNMEEDFADDEEGVNGLFGSDDEESKRTQERVKREQLAANAFALKDEKDVWQEEEDAKLEAELRRKLEKSLRKKIVKREKNYNYDLDDSDENPYTSESESDDSEAERQKEEERKREEERTGEKDKGKAKADEKPPSGTTSKGSNTPSGRPKTSDPLKLSSSQNLKRPGSPNLSDASGNESARKKQKKLGGSGSDSEATDREKLKVRLSQSGSGTGTPGGSRAGSPVAGASRAGSPAASGGLPARPRTAPRPAGPLPTVEEIKAVIPRQGATMGTLIAAFKGRVSPAVQHDFINNVKLAGTFDKKTKMIFPRAS